MEQSLCTDKLEPPSQSNYNNTENSKCLLNVLGKANEKVEEVTMAPGTGKVSSPLCSKNTSPVHFTNE